MRINSDIALATAVRRAATALAARARVERRGDLTLNEVAALGRIAVEGPITPREVADQLRTLPQSLTRTLASLEDAGLVRRTPDPADGRGALLTITIDGQKALRAEMGPRDRWIASAIRAGCTDDEKATLAEAAEIMMRLVHSGEGVAPVEP